MIALLALLTVSEATVIKLATVAPDGSPWAQGLVDLKKAMDDKLAGKVKLKPFLGGTLGDENESVMACKRGQVQAFGGSTGAVATLVPELNVLELPYLFNNTDEADYVIDNVAAPMFDKLFKDRGLVVGFWSENGFRSYGGKFAVSKPSDLKGRKIRSQENPIHLATHRAFGASPVPIPTTEALTALQTGVVDGYDQSPLFTFAASWHTASQHYSVTNHIYQSGVVVFHKPTYDALPEEAKQVIRDFAKNNTQGLRKQIRAMTPILLDNLKASNVQVHIPQDLSELKKAAESVRTDWAKKASPSEKQLYTAIDKALKEYRAK